MLLTDSEAGFITAGCPSCQASGIVRMIDPLHFLAGCRKRQLNQAQSVSVSLGFCVCSFVLFIRATFYVSLICISVCLSFDCCG